MFKSVKSNIRRIKARGGSWIDRWLQGTSDHYRCLLPRRKGGFFRGLFEIIFSGIRMDERQIRVIRKRKCHVCGRRSNQTADLWFPERAESASKAAHKAQVGPDINYLRACSGCLAAALEAARAGAAAAA